MERFDDLCIILKNYPYQDRDRIAVCLTEKHGKITGLAKGAIHSRRYGGSLDFLACSRVHFTQKPHAELARIDEAHVHHEFRNISLSFEALSAASFVAEFCLRLLEHHTPSRDIFVIVSNVLHLLDQGADIRFVVNSFLCKMLRVMGYPPNLLRCVQCEKGAHEAVESYSGRSDPMAPIFWSSESGGMLCWSCAATRSGAGANAVLKNPIQSETLLRFQQLTTASFREIVATPAYAEALAEADHALYRVLTDFVHHHVPGLPAEGFKSWRVLNESLVTL